MELSVLSRNMIEDESYLPTVPHIIISIRDPNQPLAKVVINNQCLGILYLSFWDMDRAEGKYTEVITTDHARRVLDFVAVFKNLNPHVVCQCVGGVARSSGTAAALSKIYNGSDEIYFNHSKFRPNRRVFSLIISEHYQRGMLDERKTT